MKTKVLIVLAIQSCLLISTLSAEKTTIYLIPGQGGDYRLFNNLQLDEAFDVAFIHHETPIEGISIRDYALHLAHQIDTTEPFILIGVSLGGMVATEMSEFLNPEKVIVISSAKSRQELPGRYTFQRKVPVYKVVSNRMAKIGAQIMQPIVEPDRRKEKETFKNMLKAKDPEFLRVTIGMIINWERESHSEHIIHIHGDKDRTIPIKNVAYDYLVEGGSHMMVLTRGAEISQIINEILLKA